MTFDRDEFVTDCLTAVRETDVLAAVAEVVQRRLGDGKTIDRAFTDARPGPVTLYAAPELTVQRIEWSPGFSGSPHDHRMWAVVGVYGGAEHNRFHRRSLHGLEDAGGRVVGQGEAIVLDADAIHSVSNPSRRPVGGLHVYGGNIDSVPRSQWRPDGSEGPLAQVRAEYMTVWTAMREFAKEQRRSMSDAAVFDAFSELNRLLAERQRILTRDEVRAALTKLWSLNTES